MKTDDKLHTSPYVKDRFAVSHEVCYELSMISNLPNLSKVKKLTKSQFCISNCPNNITGVQ